MRDIQTQHSKLLRDQQRHKYRPGFRPPPEVYEPECHHIQKPMTDEAKKALEAKLLGKYEERAELVETLSKPPVFDDFGHPLPGKTDKQIPF